MKDTDERSRRQRRAGWLIGSLLIGGTAYALVSSPSAPATDRSPSTASSASTGIVLAPVAASTAVSTPGGSDSCNANGNCEKSFGVTVGALSNLYPGAARQLPVRYDNPNNFDIVVSTYTATVSVPSAVAASCPAKSLVVPSGAVQLSPGVTVAKNAGTSTTIPISLAPTAPNACQRVSFTITVNATAVKK